MTNFELGRTRGTPGAVELMQQGLDVAALLGRHARGDWGDLGDDDRQANEDALPERRAPALRVQDARRQGLDHHRRHRRRRAPRVHDGHAPGGILS